MQDCLVLYHQAQELEQQPQDTNNSKGIHKTAMQSMGANMKDGNENASLSVVNDEKIMK